MHHPRAEYLHPAGALAARTAGSVTELALDVHLRRRLSEREIARPKTSLGFAEESVGEVSQCRLEIDEADTLVDGEAFDLCEHRRERCVEEVTTVRVSRAENANRRLELLHRADLHRRSVRPEQNVLAQVKRVVEVECGVVGRKV